MHMLSKELMKLLEKDIKKVVDQGEIKPTDYNCLSTAVDIYKDLTTIVAMEEAQEQQNSYNSYNSYGNGGMSGMQSYGMNSMMPNYRDGWTMDQGYTSRDGYSGARGRSHYTGRYVSRDADPMTKLNEMMANAKTPEEQNMIRRMMDEFER